MHLKLFPIPDAGGFQIRTHSQKGLESQTCNASVVCFKAFENANKVSGQTMEEVQHEDHVCYLYQSQAPLKWWLGLWEWYVVMDYILCCAFFAYM